MNGGKRLGNETNAKLQPLVKSSNSVVAESSDGPTACVDRRGTVCILGPASLEGVSLMGMGSRVLYGVLLSIALVATGFGFALAQDGQSAVQPGAGENSDAALQLERQANLSGPEQLAQAELISNNAAQVARRVQQMLDEARGEGDMVRITCLDDKLTQVNSAARILGERSGALNDAVQANNGPLRNHEFIVISVLGQRLQLLEQEANQCVSAEIFEVGESLVTTTIEEETPAEDPTITPTPPELPFPGSILPPPASPFM